MRSHAAIDLQHRDATQQGRIEVLLQASDSMLVQEDGDLIQGGRIGLIQGFHAVDQRAALQGCTATVGLHVGVCHDGVGCHVECQLNLVSG